MQCVVNLTSERNRNKMQMVDIVRKHVHNSGIKQENRHEKLKNNESRIGNR